MLGGYESIVLTGTTDGSGDLTLTSAPITGRIVQIDYLEDGSAPFADGALADFHCVSDGMFVRDFKFHDTASGTLNASATILPSYIVYAADGSDSGTTDFFCFHDEKLKIVIASGGASKVGTFKIKLKA